MLDLEVTPSRSLGPFVLGMNLSDALRVIVLNKRVSAAELLYDEQHLLDHDTLVSLPNDGIVLHFESRMQRLRLIEVGSGVRK